MTIDKEEVISIDKRNLKGYLYSYATAILAYLIDLFFICRMGPSDMDSDLSAEMVLANLLNKEASISGISQNWFYSSELRVLHLHWLYRIGLFFFPDNWSLARTLGMAIALLIYAACIVLLFYSIGKVKIAPFAVTLCLLPGGSWYFWQTIFGGVYIPYILISIVITAFVLLFHNKDKNRWIYVVGIVLVSFLSGLNGIKQLMVFFAPLVLASLTLFLLDIRKEGNLEHIRKVQKWDYLVLSTLGALSSFSGYLINSRILSQIYSFESFSDRRLHGGDFWGIVRGYLWSFGYSDNKIIMSFAGIASVIGLAIGIATLVSGALLISSFDKLSFGQRFITALSLISIIFNAFIFAYTDGGMQYFQPIVPFGLILIVICVDTRSYVLPKGKSIVLYMLVCLELITSIGTMQSEFDGPLHIENRQPGLESVVSFLKEQGYKEGVSEFWQGNVITELSDGTIEMWVLNADGTDNMYKWLQAKDHCDSFPDGDYFLIVLNGLDYSSFLTRHSELSLIYNDANYMIYGTK